MVIAMTFAYTLQALRRASVKRNPREEHARRMAYLMQQSSQVDDLYTPPPEGSWINFANVAWRGYGVPFSEAD
jgi:hypothetical protein